MKKLFVSYSCTTGFGNVNANLDDYEEISIKNIQKIQVQIESKYGLESVVILNWKWLPDSGPEIDMSHFDDLEKADILAKAVDDSVADGAIDSRSTIADARLECGAPNEYKWLKKIS